MGPFDTEMVGVLPYDVLIDGDQPCFRVCVARSSARIAAAEEEIAEEVRALAKTAVAAAVVVVAAVAQVAASQRLAAFLGDPFLRAMGSRHRPTTCIVDPTTFDCLSSSLWRIIQVC